MYLNENLEQLNKEYETYGIAFEFNKSVIKVREAQRFLLNRYPELKEKLKEKYNLTFNDKYKWHIGKNGVKKLKINRIKVKPSRAPKELLYEIFQYLSKIEEQQLKDSITSFFKSHRDFFNAPASKYYHHDYKGGLLEHTVQTVEFALAIYENSNNEIDKDLIIAGAILHDIGKIHCYEQHGDFIDITDTFLTQEHIINGIKILSQEISSEKLDDLIHIIASHHNLKEWGSPVHPMSNEAWIVYFADNISSKIG